MDPNASSFLATALGAALGVIAGVAVQYGVQGLASRRERSAQMGDISAEAVYNEGVVDDLIAECARLRASSHPGGLAVYYGVFRFNDILWIAMSRMVQSGQLYRSFNHQEIEKIQKCMVFLSAGTGQFVANRITAIKANNDVKDGLSFANYIEGECKKHIETIRQLKAKR